LSNVAGYCRKQMRPGYTPLPNPPPPGSPWEAIERARKKLGWSARKLSSEATGKPGSSHYSVISLRKSWDTELSTLEQFIAALVRAGIPEVEVRHVPSVAASDPSTELRDEIAETLIRKGYKIRRAEQAAELVLREPSRAAWVARAVEIAAGLIDAEAQAANTQADPKQQPPSRGGITAREKRAFLSKIDQSSQDHRAGHPRDADQHRDR
jgi:hypothetical protein